MAELNVSKKTIEQVLGKEDEHVAYVIPDYQRPYRWDREKCEILWDDIVSFFRENRRNRNEYYLGTLVLCKTRAAGKKEIIDGQQRITSFVLMLRAFYKKLEEMEDQDDDVTGLRCQIEPCIWKVASMSKKVKWKKDSKSEEYYVTNPIRIESRAITDNDKDSLDLIMKHGKKGEGESNYQENYQFFCDAYNEYAGANPNDWKELCLFVLKRCILLPVECKDLKTALTIFYTLNDRGMPLSDTDIFKAQLYKKQNSEAAKQRFVKKWKKLEEDAESLGIEMDSIFRYYSHYIRGKDGNTNKEKALRTFYGERNYEKLGDAKLISNLDELIDFWGDILSSKPDKYIGVQGRKYVHCLRRYPNEYWRYAVSVFFLVRKKDKDTDEFKRDLECYLAKITAFFYAKFIVDPTVNSVKDDVYRLCKNLCAKKAVELSVKDYSAKKMADEFMGRRISDKAVKGLLLLKAYLHKGQNGIIPEKVQIEHILPRKSDDAYYQWDKKERDKYVDNIGNKIVIEKKVNIRAGNAFFSEKKKRYKNSNIAELKQLSKCQSNDWFKDDIDKRKKEIIKTLVKFFKKNGVVS